jgi:hypothetical protein
VLSLVLAGLVTYMAQNGGGRHLYYLTPQQQMLVIKLNWIAQVFGIMAFAAVKISVSLLIMRIITLNNVWMRNVLWFVMGSMALFSVLDCIFNFVQCDPPRALWEPQYHAQVLGQSRPEWYRHLRCLYVSLIHREAARAILIPTVY